MVRLVIGTLLVGALVAWGTMSVHKPWADQVVQRCTEWMDDVMGLKDREALRKQKAAEARRKMDKAAQAEKQDKRLPTRRPPPPPPSSTLLPRKVVAEGKDVSEPTPGRPPAALPVAPSVSPPSVPAPVYVNRDPTPSALPKEPEKDRRKLDQLIAERLAEGPAGKSAAPSTAGRGVRN